MMKENLYFIFIICILFSCTNCSTKTRNKENDSSQNEMTFAGIPIIDLNKEYPLKEIVLQDVANVEYVPLETNKNTLLSSFISLTITEDYIITNDKLGTLHFFHKDGRISHSFNHKGQSGNEYTSIITFCVDPLVKEIFVYDNIMSKIQVYTYDGVYKRTINTPQETLFQSILDYDKDFLIVEDSYNVDYINEDVKVNNTPYYKISKKDGKFLSIPLILPKRIRDGLRFNEGNLYGGVSLYISPIAKINSDIMIADFSLDTVYTFRNDKFFPIAVRHNTVSKNNIPIIATVDAITNRYLLWYTIEKNIDIENRKVSDPISYLFDKQTNDCFRTRFINIDVDPSVEATEFRDRLSANKYVMPQNSVMKYYPADILLELNKADKLSGKLKEIASKLKEDDNPVLLIAKFKE